MRRARLPLVGVQNAAGLFTLPDPAHFSLAVPRNAPVPEVTGNAWYDFNVSAPGADQGHWACQLWRVLGFRVYGLWFTVCLPKSMLQPLAVPRSIALPGVTGDAWFHLAVRASGADSGACSVGLLDDAIRLSMLDDQNQEFSDLAIPRCLTIPASSGTTWLAAHLVQSRALAFLHLSSGLGMDAAKGSACTRAL